MVKDLELLYQKLFSQLGIDKNTGEFIGDNKNIKFATYPFVGARYQKAKRKILFVGLDIGKDETPGRMQGFDERRENIACDSNFNPHIAGTYTMALHLLKDEYGWQNVWDKIKGYSTSQQATRTKNHSDGENPLDYVSLTNFYKFVDIARENRSGDKNRKYISKEVESQFFIDEVKVFAPDVIIFQGNCPTISVITELKELSIALYKAPHPSNRALGGRQPENYINKLNMI